LRRRVWTLPVRERWAWRREPEPEKFSVNYKRDTAERNNRAAARLAENAYG
jgi:hypothetical protein